MKRIVCALIAISAFCMLLGTFLAYRWSIQDIEPIPSPESSRRVTMERVAEVLSDFDELIPKGLATSDSLEERTWVTAFYSPISNSNSAKIEARSASGSSIVDALVCEFNFVNESDPLQIVERLTILVFGSNQHEFTLKGMHEGATYVSNGWSRRVVRLRRDFLLITFVREKAVGCWGHCRFSSGMLGTLPFRDGGMLGTLPFREGCGQS